MSGWLASLRNRRLLAGEGLRMGLLTGLSFVLGYLLTALLVEWLGMAPQAAYAIAIVTCSIVNFFGCRHFVFRTTSAPLLPEAAKFFASILAFRAIEVGLFHLFFVASGDYRLAYLATTALSTLGKFAVAKLFIFKKPRRSGGPS